MYCRITIVIEIKIHYASYFHVRKQWLLSCLLATGFIFSYMTSSGCVTRNNKPFFLMLTKVPPHTDLLVVSTMAKARLATEHNLLTVWHDTTAVFGDVDMVLRAVVVAAGVHVVLVGAAIYQ